MTPASRVWAVVPAAGRGTRMGADVPKQYLPLAGRTVLEQTLRGLAEHPAVCGLVLAVSESDPCWPALAATLSLPVPLRTVLGGSERQLSVLNGLRSLRGEVGDGDWVLVHDAARPCLRHVDLDRLLSSVGDFPDGAILALPATDTMKRGDAAGQVVETVERAHLWRALTPQMFRIGDLIHALERAVASGFPVTDEASAMEFVGRRPGLVEGHPDNIKITHPADLDLAALFIQRHGQAAASVR